jgi:hypothetical protein
MTILTTTDIGLHADGIIDDTDILQNALNTYTSSGAIISLNSNKGFFFNKKLKIPSNIHLKFLSHVYFGKYGSFTFNGSTKQSPQSNPPYITNNIILTNTITVNDTSIFNVHDTIIIYLSSKITTTITNINDNDITISSILPLTTLSNYNKKISVYKINIYDVSNTIKPNTNIIKLNNTTDINKYDYIKIINTQTGQDTAGSSTNPVNVEITQIIDINHTEKYITISTNLANHYNTDLYKTYIEILEPITNSSIEHAQISYITKSSSRLTHAIIMKNTVNCYIHNCHIVRHTHGNYAHGFHIYESFNSNISNCSSNNPEYTNSGEGYGFCINKSSFCRITNCLANGDRHGYLIQASNFCTISDSQCLNDKSSGIDIHGINSQYNTISNCLIVGGNQQATNTNSRTGIKIGNTTHHHGDHHNIIQNCTIQNYKGRAIEILQPCSYNIIRNCTIKNTTLGVRMGQLSKAPHLSQHDNIIQNCTFDNVDSVYYINQYTKINNNVNTIKKLTLFNNLCTNIKNNSIFKNISNTEITLSDTIIN